MGAIDRAVGQPSAFEVLLLLSHPPWEGGVAVPRMGSFRINDLLCGLTFGFLSALATVHEVTEGHLGASNKKHCEISLGSLKERLDFAPWAFLPPPPNPGLPSRVILANHTPFVSINVNDGGLSSGTAEENMCPAQC